MELEFGIFYVFGLEVTTSHHLLRNMVVFPEDSPNKTTPFANTCFRELIVPVVHHTYESFSQVMDTCLKLGVAGFSEV